MMVRLAAAVSAAALLPAAVIAHGHITYPTGRNNGSIELAGDCNHMECMWFSQPATIPGEPTLPDYARTMQTNVSAGPNDFSRGAPWRAPGSAPVYGSGCGVAGGGPVPYSNGGNAPEGYTNGDDFLSIPAGKPAVWRRGATEEVAYAIFANHGGGVSWRLCSKKSGNISEECFAHNSLEYSGNTQWIRYQPMVQWDSVLQLPDFPIPAVRVTEGTHPPGSHWTRNPVPPCLLCSQADCMRKYPSQKMGDAGWEKQQHCSQACAGLNITGRNCPPGLTQFPEPAPGISGYYAQECTQPGGQQSGCDPLAGFQYSIVDKVIVPRDIVPGEYLLSWRWDCEQSKQIWQNCVDLIIV